MRKYLSIIFILFIVYACDDFMDVVPDNIATLDNAFSDKERAEKYLFRCYAYIPPFGTSTEPGLVCGDENWYHRDPNNYAQPGWDLMRHGNNVSTPIFDYWGGRYQALRDCNIFLENIDKVLDLDDYEKKRWIAEVKFLKAFQHFYLLQMYGPIPIVRESLPVYASSEEVAVFRDPVDDVVDYIVQLIDEAVPYLPLQIDNDVSEMGRITQPIALAIKAKVLVTAASPLFNGNKNYSQLIDKRGIQLFNQTYDPQKWVKAAEACKNAIDTCHLAGHELYYFSNPSLNLTDSTAMVIQPSQIITDKWNTEHIWGKSFGNYYHYYEIQRATLPRLHPDHSTLQYPFFGPTLKMAELFYSSNGVPINEDLTYDYSGRYSLTTVTNENRFYLQPGHVTAKLHVDREPRFYGSLAVDGGWLFGLGRTKESEQWPLKFLLGQMEGGRIGTERYTITGFYIKKLSHYMTTTVGTSSWVYRRYDWPIIRLADLYLLYAEALNESLDAPNEMVYEYIDKVRQRAGLNGVAESWSTYSSFPEKYKTKEGMREIIQQERSIELMFEGHRFWDIRRWGLAVETFSQPIQGWNIEGEKPGDFYQKVTIDNIKYSIRDVLWPLKESDLLVNPNLVQNPGW
jgi:hypothetical protein